MEKKTLFLKPIIFILIAFYIITFNISLSFADVSFEIRKIADTNTQMPGETEGTNFQSFKPPSIDFGNVAFEGCELVIQEWGYSKGQLGIYKYNTESFLSLVANRNTPIPGWLPVGYYYHLNNPEAFFRKVGFSELYFGAFVKDGDALDVIYMNRINDEPVYIPGTQLSPNVDAFSFDNSKVVFRSNYAIFSKDFDNNFSIIIDENTPIPGRDGYFGDLAHWLLIKDGTTVFTYDDRLYKHSNNLLSVVADENTIAPNFQKNFIHFDSLSTSDGDIAFRGSVSLYEAGVYAIIDGELKAIVDPTMALGGAGNPSIDNGNVAFMASSSSGNNSPKGLYVYINGSIQKVIATGDTFAGKEIISLEIRPKALSENQLVFLACFTDGSQGIYMAEFNLPTCGDNLWNIRFNADDRFDSNESYLRPWRYNNDDGWGRWVGMS